MNHDTFYQSVRNFLQQRNPNMQANEIADTDNLFDCGYIDSLSITEFLIFLEELLGREIPIENYTPRTFHSMKNLFDAFCAVQS